MCARVAERVVQQRRLNLNAAELPPSVSRLHTCAYTVCMQVYMTVLVVYLCIDT